LGNNIHVCIITSARLFDFSIGGEGKFTNELSNWLSFQQYHVSVLASTFTGVRSITISRKSNDNNEKTAIKELNWHSNKRVIYPPYLIYALSRLAISIQAVWRIIRIHRKDTISIIHAQDTGYSGLASVISGKILRVPVIVSSHGVRHKTLGTQLNGRWSKWLLKLEYKLDKFTCENATAIIVVNPYIKKYFEDMLYTSDQARSAPCIIEHIPIPVDITRFSFSQESREIIRKEFGILDHKVVIGFIGRLVAAKNIDTLIRAFSEIAENHPNAFLLIVGSGDREEDLKRLADSIGVRSKVIFTGSRSDVNRILSALDIFVLPSYSEGLSASLLEAMASGRAIIGSDIEGNSVLIQHSESGLLFDPSKQRQLEDALSLLLEDYKLREKLGSSAMSIALKYDTDAVFPKIEKYYHNILSMFNQEKSRDGLLTDIDRKNRRTNLNTVLV
jgi:glycosyltransferase involved in cell wall biosynthesis